LAVQRGSTQRSLLNAEYEGNARSRRMVADAKLIASRRTGLRTNKSATKINMNNKTHRYQMYHKIVLINIGAYPTHVPDKRKNQTNGSAIPTIGLT
jgi:hypothetical protein